MAASDNLHPALFHGTAGRIKGKSLRPNPGAYGTGVYSTDDMRQASWYARSKADKSDIDPETGQPDGKTTRPLFGTIYEIDNSKAVVMAAPSSGYIYKSTGNTPVKGAVAFPIPEYALPEPRWEDEDEDEDEVKD